ncbi:MAG TPA: glycosyltransferase, partial [Verrucomicrobiota bacterium]|nr:glycosyltransferase [Verrucomicrobiota bacterium]
MTDQFKILWLKTGLLHPLDTGGKLRTFNMLKVLNRRHKITYLAFSLPETSEESKKKASEYSSSQVLIPFNEAKKRSPKFYCELFLNLFSKYPYAVEKYKSDLMTKAIAEMESDFDIVVCDFLAPSINWIRATKQPSKSLLFQHNVEALIWKRLAENSNSYFTHLYLKSQWKRMRNFEKNASARFGGVVGVSDEDCRIMREEYGLTNVLGSVPTGVDIEYFRPDGRAPEQGYILFLGSMDWMPNIDAVQYFVNSIYPIIKGKYPSAKFVIVGRNPVKSV